METNSQTGSDLIINLDSSSLTTGTINPSFHHLINQIDSNIDLDKSKKSFEIEEKKLHIAMLEDKKLFKSEISKYDLLEKEIDLKKKNSELEFTAKLRDLLIEAINNGDFNKVYYLNMCLNQKQIDVNDRFNIGFERSRRNSSTMVDDNFAKNDDNFNEDSNENTDIIISNNGESSALNQDQDIFLEDSETTSYDQGMRDEKFEISYRNFLPNTPIVNRSLLRYNLSTRNIRHLICSSSRLEDYTNSAAVLILFKGKCYESDICRREEEHTHYLIDTTECKRHISLYFQSNKHGIKIYKTYQIKTQAEFERIIKTFRMRQI